jgi:hypothetical protein
MLEMSMVRQRPRAVDDGRELVDAGVDGVLEIAAVEDERGAREEGLLVELEIAAVDRDRADGDEGGRLDPELPEMDGDRAHQGAGAVGDPEAQEGGRALQVDGAGDDHPAADLHGAGGDALDGQRVDGRPARQVPDHVRLSRQDDVVAVDRHTRGGPITRLEGRVPPSADPLLHGGVGEPGAQ